MSTIREEYNKAYRNLQSRIRRQAKRGYVGYTAPQKVKNPTRASIERLNRITAKDIRSAAKTFVSPSTGELTSFESLNREHFNRRAASAKRAAIKRKEYREELQRSFEQEFNADYDIDYPSESTIKSYNFVKDYVSSFTPLDYFNDLISALFSADSRKEFYRVRLAKLYEHQISQSVLLHKLTEIVNSNKFNDVYNEIVRKGLENELQEAINQSLYAYEEDAIKEGRTRALSILNMGVLTQQEYNSLLSESDDEA